MKKTLNITIIAMILMAAALLSGCRYGRGPHTPEAMEKRADFAVDMVARELDFNSKQKDQLVRIKEDVLAKMKEHASDRETHKAEIIAMIRNNEITEEKISDMFDRHMEKKREMKPFIVEKIVEFNNILTDEQRQKVADHIENHKMPNLKGKF